MEAFLFYAGRAVQDMLVNRFLNLMTIMTIALCTLVISSFVLFYENGTRLIRSWSQGGRVVVYLNAGATSETVGVVQKGLEQMEMTEDIRFISKQRALEDLKTALSSGTAYLDTLRDNPLPDSFIVRMKSVSHGKEGDIRRFSQQISTLPHVESVEYGRIWIERVEKLFAIFKVSGSIMIILFCMVALFATGNTARLSIYARQEEFVIMRLVGATEQFMVMPFHIVGVIQGGVGALTGLLILAGFYTLLLSYSGGRGLADLSFFSMKMEFLSPFSFMLILTGGVFLGWIGCFFSLKQYLKN